MKEIVLKIMTDSVIYASLHKEDDAQAFAKEVFHAGCNLLSALDGDISDFDKYLAEVKRRIENA